MKKLKNLKHIFVITLVSLTFLFGLVWIFSAEFQNSINGFFIYRTTGGVWQDYFHRHNISPSYFPENEHGLAQSKIKIVKIDDDSLNYLQAHNITFGKNIYTEITRKLEDAGVKGIAFDIIFAVADTTPSTTQSGMSNEEEFAKVTKNYGNIVIATEYQDQFCTEQLKIFTNWYKGLDIKSVGTHPDATDCNKRLAGIITTNFGILPDSDKIKYQQFMETFKEKGNDLNNFKESLDYRYLYCQRDIGNESSYEGCLNVPRSVYRDVLWGTINIDDSYTRSFGTQISTDVPYASWKSGSGTQNNAYLSTLPAALYQITGGDISQFQTNKKILNPYFGPENSYGSISLRDVLTASPQDLRVTFDNSYVIVGNTQKVNGDFVTTPVTNNLMAGVEIHAHFLDGLLQNKMLIKISDQTLGISTILLTIFSILIYFWVPKYLSPIVAIVMIVCILWLSRYLYDSQRLLVDIFPLFLASGVLTFPMTFIYRFFVVDREKRHIENAFGHYIDPKMVEMINMEEVEMTLGGEQRELSIFFSDIAGFTTISEQLSPQDLFCLMSSYLSRMTDILKHEGGTLDKYIGDAVMGFFGAPVSQSDHAIRACRTAIAMRRVLPEFNTEITARGIHPIDFRVGIASGNVMVGNIGSHDHFNYTVLGDTVNLASRLEATGKEYNVHIIISEGTRSQIGDIFTLRELDTIAVKGKTEGIRIYELLEFAGDTMDHQVYDTYSQALGLYRASQYLDAGKLWESQMEIDPPSGIMARRCLEILKGELQVENGVYHMTHK